MDSWFSYFLGILLFLWQLWTELFPFSPLNMQFYILLKKFLLFTYLAVSGISCSMRNAVCRL